MGYNLTLISRISQNYTLNLCGIGAICVSKKPRTLHADVPTPSLLKAHRSLLIAHNPLLIAHNSKICRIGVICVPLKNERRILHKVEAIHCGMKGDSWAKYRRFVASVKTLRCVSKDNAVHERMQCGDFIGPPHWLFRADILHGPMQIYCNGCRRYLKRATQYYCCELLSVSNK